MISDEYAFLKAGNADAKEATEGTAALLAYLRRYGYLDHTADADARDDSGLVFALRKYQHLHGLPVTGRFDDATATQMTIPRCGVPDRRVATDGSVLAERMVTGGPRWPGSLVTFGIVVPPSSIAASAALAAFASAAALWSAVVPITLAESATPNLRISFFGRAEHGDGLPFDGPGNALGHAFDPPPHPMAGEMHHDDDESWATSLPIPQGAFDLVTHFAHELGHALGLHDHSTDRASLMFASYTGPHRFLSPEDQSRIRAIYGP